MARLRGVLIVSLRGLDNVEAKREQISKVRGVVDAKYSYVTGKLEVRYSGDDAALRKIESQINEVLQTKQGGGGH